MNKYYKLIIFCVLINLGNCSLQEPIDLTWNFDNETIYWTGVQTFVFTKKLAIKNNGLFYAMNEFCAGEHGGTHLDAPYHFSEKGMTVGEIPFETLIVPGVVVDMSKEIETNGPTTNLEVKHLNKWVEQYGAIPNNSVILVRFGWSKYWPDKQKYFGINGTKYTFPGISKEAAQWIVDTKKVVGVGVDTASIDAGSSTIDEAHIILHGKGLYLLENVNIKEELPARDFTLFVMPMKILHGTGAPLRIIATPIVDFVKYK